jgi:cold shock protein
VTDNIKIGTIRRYFVAKGFGFIEPDDGSPDVFFHATDISMHAAEPEPGQRASYVEGERNGRMQAKSVRYI